MLKALIDGKLSYASPGARGICPFCETPVISKCGGIKINHWAHENLSDCDVWHEPEGWWHLNWKQEMTSLMPNIKVEQIIEKKYGFEKVRHIADLVVNNTVIELQNSPISPRDIVNREIFYKNMIWIFNGLELNYYLYSRNYGTPISHTEILGLVFQNVIVKWVNFKIKWLKKSLLYCSRPIAIDVGSHILRIKTLHEKGYGSCDVFPRNTFMQYLTKL